MRTHGHREGSITHWGLSGEIGKGQWEVGSWGEIAWGEMPDVGDGGGGMEIANHHGIYVPIQQSCRMQDVHMCPEAQKQF